MSVQVIERFNRIPGVPAKADAGAADALNKAVARTIQVADPLTRVDRGLLKGNKRIVNASPGSLTASVDWLQEYAIYQDKGTVFMSGTFFADNGAEAARPQLVSDMTAVGFKLA